MPQDEDTPLHLAALRGHAAVVGMLLAAGADKEALNLVSGGGGRKGGRDAGMGASGSHTKP